MDYTAFKKHKKELKKTSLFFIETELLFSVKHDAGEPVKNVCISPDLMAFHWFTHNTFCAIKMKFIKS